MINEEKDEDIEIVDPGERVSGAEEMKARGDGWKIDVGEVEGEREPEKEQTNKRSL